MYKCKRYQNQQGRIQDLSEGCAKFIWGKNIKIKEPKDAPQAKFFLDSYFFLFWTRFSFPQVL